MSLSTCPTITGIHAAWPNVTGCPKFVPEMLSRQKSLPPQAPLLIVNRSAFYLYGDYDETGKNLMPYYFGDSPVHFADLKQAIVDDYRQAIVHTACEIAKTRPVYMLRPIPEMPVYVPQTAPRELFLTGKMPDISISLEQYHQRQAVAWAAQDEAAAQCGVKILDPLPYLCWGGRCHGIKDGKALYSDFNHLSLTGAALLEPLFAQMFKPQNSPQPH